MTDPLNLDALGIEELVDLKEKVEKKLNEKITAERTELEQRQAKLAKLTGRVSGKKATKAAGPKGPGGRRADARAQNDGAHAANGRKEPAAPAASDI